MKLHLNQKKILFLIAVTILGILLNAAPEMLLVYTRVSLPVYFLGTVLVTMLCGSFPGMAAAAGGVILQYEFYSDRFDLEAANALVPLDRVLYGVLIALVLGKLLRREAYRKPWTAIPVTLLFGLLIALLSQIIPVLRYSVSALTQTSGAEGLQEILDEVTSADSLLAVLGEAGSTFLGFIVSMIVSFAVCRLLPAKWREKLRTVSWMMKPLPVETARRIQKSSGKGRGHSLKSRITVLVTFAVLFSAMIIMQISVNNTLTLVDEGFGNAADLSAEYAAALVTPEMAAEIQEKGAEAEGYEQTRERLQNIVELTDKLSGICVLRATEDGFQVLFDVASGEVPVQDAGEILGNDSFAGSVLAPTADEVEYSVAGYTGSGSNRVYRSIYPVFAEGDFGDPEADSRDPDAPEDEEQPDALFWIIPYVRSAAVSDYATLFILRIIVEFSGFFILLLSFGFWISRFYMVYPIASMSARADQISSNLEDAALLDRNIAEMTDLSIHTADETETLYRAVCRMAQSLSARMKSMQALFDGTVTALVSAIDAKDQYTHGHSSRVAVYSRRIAELSGKSEKECEEIYLSALLHDIGKIGISGDIINKKGRLTDEEFNAIKQHPTIGYQILNDITEYPYLNVAAHYHHERYDGRGYPDGLKGEEIPEIARIIAVADAYDAMTSNRSYRTAIPQHIVKEELIKGSGTQFDPQFARYMIQLIDHDVDYRMQESPSRESNAPQRGNLVHRDRISGYHITEEITRMRLYSKPDEDVSGTEGYPTLIAFDSLDGMVHPGEENNRDLMYYEYARIRLDGQVTERNVRKSEVRTLDGDPGTGQPSAGSGMLFRIEAFRRRDHALIRIAGAGSVREVILAMPDNTRFLYLSVGGDHCQIQHIYAEKDETAGGETIPRIAEAISYIKDCPEGNIPNLEVDGWRTAATDGIPIRDGISMSFHAKSLPTARMIWHCPFVSIFSSSDGKVNGPDFREYILLRLDGESWESDDHVKNDIHVERGVAFAGWNDWKDRFRAGLDCMITVRRNGNRISMRTENLGVAIRSETTILDEGTEVLLALTGDQCTITNIRVMEAGGDGSR